MTTDHDAHLDRDDKDGFIHVGRASDLIIRGGNNIDPVVIERALLAHPEVTGAVVDVPDNQHLRTAISVALDRYPLRWRFSRVQG